MATLAMLDPFTVVGLFLIALACTALAYDDMRQRAKVAELEATLIGQDDLVKELVINLSTERTLRRLGVSTLLGPQVDELTPPADDPLPLFEDAAFQM